ncbi:MAG: hypothetical protein AAGA21_00565 [Pseudomonadota bacterium]
MKLTATILTLTLIALVPAAEAGAKRLVAEQAFSGTTKAEAWKAVMASLEANDLPVIASDFERGQIRVRQHNYLDRRFAACPSLDNRNFNPLSPSNIGARSWPLYRGVDLRLEITGTATGTRLALDPRYYNVGRDEGRREFAVQVRCRSTGVLEKILFTAVENR